MIEQNQQQKVTRQVSQKWDRLMRLGSRLNYGEARVIFKNGEPIRVEQIIKSISLDMDDEFKREFETVML